MIVLWSVKQYTFYDDRVLSATPNHRQQLDKGCFRYVPDTINEQVENWRERMYTDVRPVGMRKAKQRR